MSQHDFDITTADANTGVSFRAEINNALKALASQSSGAGNPAATYPFQIKIDTAQSPAVAYIRKADNSGWVRYGSVNASGQLIVDLAETTSGTSGGVAFHAFKPSPTHQSLASGSHNKVTFTSEHFDTHNIFNTTNSRLTPTSAGRYLLAASIGFSDPTVLPAYGAALIYKNGAQHKASIYNLTQTGKTSVSIVAVMDANGTTDYFEVFVDINAGSCIIFGDPLWTYFSGNRI